MSKILSVTACLSALTIAACAPTVETTPVTAELPPAEIGDFPVSSEWTGLDKGNKTTMTLVKAKGDRRSFQSTTGCSWTESVNFLAPTLEWENCDGNSGSQTIGETSGEIWPLQVGRTQAWSLTGKNGTGDTWQTTQTCEVESAERITVPAGSFDAYKVVCRDTWNVRTWYYAPALKETVFYTRMHKKRGLESKWEYISGPGLVAQAS